MAALDSRTATRAAPVFRRPAPLFDEAEGAEEEQAAAGAEAGQNSSILESGATQRALEELLEGGKPKPAAAPAAGAEGGSSSKDEPLR